MPPAMPPAPPADPNSPVPAMKSSEENINLKKSLDEKDEIIQKQTEALNRLSEAFMKVANKPLRKSIDSVAILAKPVEDTSTLTKSEALAKLNVVSRKSDLKKSDRQLINQFVLGHVNLDAVAHLLRD
jgi:type I site-specific restriction endonuclease